jgi:DNA transformation protein
MDWIDGITDRLSGLEDISSRAMFGGYGIYRRGVIFAIAQAGRLYLKVNEDTRPAFEARGMGPFRPNDRQTLKSYYQVPPDVIADPEALLSWVEGAIRVGQEPQDPGMKK